MDAMADNSGAPVAEGALRRLVDVLGAEVVPAGRGTVEVSEVLIAEPGDALTDLPGALVLAVGVRGDEAGPVVAAAGAAGAAAVVLRVAGDGLPASVRAAAASAGVAVLGVAADLRWDKVEVEARAALGHGPAGAGQDRRGDLFSLAQTVATLTQGVISIEDSAHRVMAYAGPGEEADELRRLSILGRACPEAYLDLLRQWGVHRRIRTGEDVVEVGERPDMGARRRLVIGISAGSRPLGTIWVQEGARPLAERSPEVLRGAARLAASQLVDHYFQGDAEARLASREDLAHGLLTGRFDSGALAAHLGVDPSAAAAVVAVDLREHPGAGDAAWRDARRAEAVRIVSVHAAAYRRDTLVAQACGQIYAMLPEPAPAAGTRAGADDGEGLLRWAADLVTALRRHTGTPVQAVVAGTAARLDDIPAVKLRGHHGLQVLARTPDRPVATHHALTASLMVRDVLELLAGHEDIRHPALEELVAHDAELARSLLLYLDAFGDVGPVAKALNVHPNTLRYRVRKAVARTGLDLDDPEHRLAAVLQLRLALGVPGGAGC